MLDSHLSLLTVTDCSCECFSVPVNVLNGVERPESWFRLFKPFPPRSSLMLGFHHSCGEQAVPGILLKAQKPLHSQTLSTRPSNSSTFWSLSGEVALLADHRCWTLIPASSSCLNLISSQTVCASPPRVRSSTHHDGGESLVSPVLLFKRPLLSQSSDAGLSASPRKQAVPERFLTAILSETLLNPAWREHSSRPWSNNQEFPLSIPHVGEKPP